MLQAYNYLAKKVNSQVVIKNRIESLFLEVVPKIDELLKLQNGDEVDENIFDDLVAISNKIDKLKNFLSMKKNSVLISNILQIAVYHQELELAKISVAPSETKIQKVKKLLLWVEIHKYWMFSAAGGINADIEVTRKASSELVKELKKRGLITKDEIGKATVNFKLNL